MNADFFSKFGFLVVRDFLDLETCRRIRTEAQTSSTTAANVGEGNQLVIDATVRKAGVLTVPESTLALVRDRLLGLKAVLENHFQLALTDCQKLQFLAYDPGDFYLRHKDTASDPNAPEFQKQRKVSIIVFLNGHSKEPGSDSYSGGSLVFYGIMNDLRMKHYGFPLEGEEGLLIAFDSTVAHEVQPVTSGKRFSVVTWYY